MIRNVKADYLLILFVFGPPIATLEGTARYAGLLLAPEEGFGLRPRLFLPSGK